MIEDIFWILWLYILPILGACTPTLAIVWWCFIVPKVARKLTWAKFGDRTILGMAYSEGYFDLEVSRKTLGEGVFEVGKRIYRFLPRPLCTNPEAIKKFDNDDMEKYAARQQIEKLALRKYLFKGLGKPIWCGYAGKVGVVNPETVVALGGVSTPTNNPTILFEPLNKYIEDEIPKKHHSRLKTLLDDLHTKVEQLTKTSFVANMDFEVLKETIPSMHTPAQIKAVAEEEYSLGQDMKDRDVVKLALVGIIMMGMIILAIVLATQL